MQWLIHTVCTVIIVQGKDDLRQDAVMQQVFAMVNSLLVKDEQTRKRSLKVRGYKVSKVTVFPVD